MMDCKNKVCSQKPSASTCLSTTNILDINPFTKSAQLAAQKQKSRLPPSAAISPASCNASFKPSVIAATWESHSFDGFGLRPCILHLKVFGVYQSHIRIYRQCLALRSQHELQMSNTAFFPRYRLRPVRSNAAIHVPSQISIF